MFGSKSKKLAALNLRIQKLETQLKEQKAAHQEQIQVLRSQLASLVSGVAPNPKSIMDGLPYSEVPKEEVPRFIASTPGLLILDVRSDMGWNQGYIKNAKHIPAQEVFQRLGELADKTRPILTLCANGNSAVAVCQTLAREGYRNVFNALGGMAGWQGELVRPDIQASNLMEVEGTDRKLIAKILNVIDRDVRPGLKRDGGDLQVVSVEAGTVKVKLVGACVGCGAQKRTVEEGVKTHLKNLIPEVEEVVDLSLGISS